MTTRRLSDLLATNPSRLNKIASRAREMGDLTQRLKVALGEPAAGYLLAANVREDGCLVVLCSNPSWAARLRFESDTLLEAAAAAGVRADRLRVRVATAP